jgi:hypothetical protein
MTSRTRFLAAAGVAAAGLTWREFPAIVRYLRIRRM